MMSTKLAYYIFDQIISLGEHKRLKKIILQNHKRI